MNLDIGSGICSPRGYATMHTSHLPLQRRVTGEPVVVLDKRTLENMESFINSQRYTIDKLGLSLLKKEGQIQEMKTLWRRERDERRKLERALQAIQENIAPSLS